MHCSLEIPLERKIFQAKLQNSLKLSFKNIQGLRSNFVDCESFLESNSPDILALCETNLDDSIDSGNERLSSFNLKGFQYSYAWSCSLCNRRTSFCTGLISRKICRFLLMFSTGFTPLIVFLFSSIDYLLHLCVQFLILFHVTQMRLFQSAHLLFLSLETLTFIHHQDWLTYSGRTD